MSIHYEAFGLSIGADIELPELTPVNGGSALPEVIVRLGPVPRSLADAWHREPWIEISVTEFLHEVPGIGRFLVRDGSEIVVDPAPSVPEADLRLHLLGTAFGILFHQRGLCPIHANLLLVKGSGVAFIGSSGAGKSTLAAFMSRRGYPVLSDDLCVIDPGSFPPKAWPGVRHFRLCRDTVEAIGLDPDALVSASGERQKFQLANEASLRDPVPLRRLYVLAEGGKCRFERLKGVEAVEAVASNIYRPRLLGLMRGPQACFRHALAILARVELYRFERRLAFEDIESNLVELEDHLAGLFGE